MLLSVVLLMWLRTTLQYQYTTGVTTVEAFQHLYSEGGVRRFYSGVGYAMIQAPLARFGDTAANEGVKELFEGTKVPPTIVTLVAALVAGIWRVCISPVDMFKTTMQVCMWTGRATAVPPSAHSSASFDHAYPHCSLYMHARTHAHTHTHTQPLVDPQVVGCILLRLHFGGGSQWFAYCPLPIGARCGGDR
jgi:hypothetical protein